MASEVHGETHDDRCCMLGVPAGSDPRPGCPGVDALPLERERWGKVWRIQEGPPEGV